MKARSKVVLGSIAGAVAIHLVFLACGTPPMDRDSGARRDAGSSNDVEDDRTASLEDVFGEIADRETGTADAQGMPCNCLPDLPSPSFHFVPPAGMSVRLDYSRASVFAFPELVEGQPGFSVLATGSFVTAAAEQASIGLSAKTVAGSLRTGSLSLSITGGASYAAASIPGARVVVADSTIEIDIPSVTLTRQGTSPGDAGLPSITLTNVQFRGFGRNLLAIPSQFMRR